MWLSLQKPSMLACKFCPICQSLKSHNLTNNSLLKCYTTLLINGHKLKVHSGVKHLKIAKSIDVLHHASLKQCKIC